VESNYCEVEKKKREQRRAREKEAAQGGSGEKQGSALEISSVEEKKEDQFEVVRGGRQRGAWKRRPSAAQKKENKSPNAVRI